MVVGFHRPVPGHVDDLGHQAQALFIAILQPERRVACLGKIFPGYPFVLPQTVVGVISRFNEMQEFAVGDKGMAGLEGG